MPQTPFYLFLQSVITFFQRLFSSFVDLIFWIVYISPLPDWLDWGLLGILLVVILFVIFINAPGKN
jgi:hypothetical protein